MEQAFFVRVLFNNFSLRLSYNHLIQLQLASKTVTRVSDDHIRKKGTW